MSSKIVRNINHPLCGHSLKRKRDAQVGYSFFNCVPSMALVLLVKVVCSASCYQLASESLVKVIASEPCSKSPMLSGDRLC